MLKPRLSTSQPVKTSNWNSVDRKGHSLHSSTYIRDHCVMQSTLAQDIKRFPVPFARDMARQ